MQTTTKNLIETEIIVVIDYFAIYNYPINKEEISKYASTKISTEELNNTLEKLISETKIFEHNNFYSNSSNIGNQVNERLLMNKRALVLLEKSKFYSKILASFPFVEGLSISGSLSKACAKENSDIDYFVIAKPNRVWITKTTVQIFKNLLRIFNKEEYMCANYFKASDDVSLEEKSKFTEMELITMLPIYQPETISSFYKTNNWAFNKYPNLNVRLDSDYQIKLNLASKIIKKCTEFILNLFGNPLDNYLMNLTKKRWTNAHLNQYDSFEDFDKAVKVRKNEIKYHLNGAKRKSI